MIVFVDLFEPAQGLSIATQRFAKFRSFEEKIFSELGVRPLFLGKNTNTLGFYV